jgi:hypothetical protein
MNNARYQYNQVVDVKSEHRQLVEVAAGLPIEEIDIDFVNEFLNTYLESIDSLFEELHE